MKRTINALVPLIQTMEDGIEFYMAAERRTQSAELKQVFKSMADLREFALAYLRPYSSLQLADIEKSLTYHQTLSNRYAPLLEDIVEDHSLTLVHDVEEHLIDAMIEASVASHNALVQCILKDLAPQISKNYLAATNITHSEIAA